MTQFVPAARPVEFFAAALGEPTSDPAVRAVIAALGSDYEVGDYTDRLRHDYDPDIARSARWEFTRVPEANVYPSHLRVLDGTVVAIVLSPSLVSGEHTKAVTLAVPAEEEVGVLAYEVRDHGWPPVVVRRGRQHLFVLWVPQGHWDGRYRFPLTDDQVELLSSRPVWQELWDALYALCQSRRFLDEPAILPGDAQRIIDRICRRARREEGPTGSGPWSVVG